VMSHHIITGVMSHHGGRQKTVKVELVENGVILNVRWDKISFL